MISTLFARRHVLACVLLLLFWMFCAPGDSIAQSYCPTGGQGWKPVNMQAITVDALTAKGIDVSALPASPTNLAMALVSTENATIRFTFSGAPTGTSGHELAPGNNFFICGRVMIEAFQAIRTSTGSQNALVHISLFQPL